MIKGDESNKVEFKGSLEVPLLGKKQLKELKEKEALLENARQKNNHKQIAGLEKAISKLKDLSPNPEMKEKLNHSILKTLVAFANSNGGNLLIGVSEDENENQFISGIEPDLEYFGNKDKFRAALDQLIEKNIGNEFHSLFELDIVAIDNKEVGWAKVKASQNEVFLKVKEKVNGKEQIRDNFYIRRQSSTIEIKGSALVKYLKQRFHK